MFLAPAFLLGLLAIAAPLWLHRMTRADPASRPFASLMFLEASESQRTSRRTVRYWMLLALRIALLVALALAFAGPLIAQRMLPATDANTRLHAIVLDASYSMRHGDRWSRAIAEAESIIAGLRGSDRVMLVRATGRRIEVVHEPVTAGDAGALRATLQNMQPGFERLDFGLPMSAADNWLGTPRPDAVVHFISDLQRSGAPLRFADLEPPSGARLQMHAVAGEPAANAFIDHIALISGESRALRVVIRHTAAQAEQREAVLSVDGSEHSRRPVTLPAAPSVPYKFSPTLGEGGGVASEEAARADPPGLGSATVSFTGLALDPGAHRIEVRLEPADQLPEDDRRYAVIEHADPKALLIAGSENTDEATYFSAALGASDSPRLNVEERAASALEGGSLADYSMVVIPDAGSLSSAGAARLLEYVSAGGAVLATLGARVERAEIPLAPDWRVGAARERSARIGEIYASHPVLRESAEWRRVRFFRQRSVQVGEDDKVLIAYEDGSPLLVERTMGAGRLLILTAPIDRTWNDLAIHALFVQFVADAGRYLSGVDAALTSHAAGAVVMTGLTAASGGQIFDPHGKRVLSLAQAHEAERLIPQSVGFYEVRGASGARWLAVNIDARESDLTPLTSQFVQRWQALRAEEPALAEHTRAAPVSPGPRSLGPLLLAVAAVLLLAELLLANRMLAVRRE